MKINTIIVEDSRLARNELKLLLCQYSFINIVGEAKNINEAQTLIDSLSPDLLLLDINMPGGTGFDLLASLEVCPHVIFTTAFSEFAVKAFEVNALDYLLKPIETARLTDAINKVLETIISERQPDTKQSMPHKIFVKDGEQCWLIDVSNIKYFESCGNYARIYVENHKPMIYKSLTKIESCLDSTVFLRTNRQYIVNVDYIKAIEAYGSSGLLLTMQDGKEIDVSRRHTGVFKQKLSL